MGKAFEPIKGWVAHFSGAGHILGAASVLLEVGGRRILFSGDLGRPDDALMLPPDSPPHADAVVCESTYGDREHPVEDVLAELGPALKRCAARGGTTVVPAFAVGRAQALLHAIAELKARHELPRDLPIYLDSPMAIHSTGLFSRHLGEHRLSAAQCKAMESVAKMTRTADESKAIALQHGPKVIISASGMATGGRVLHHLARYLPDHRNMVLLTGYQAPGTRGATLAAGGTQLRLHGQDIAVRAEVVQLTSASAHADSNQLMTPRVRDPRRSRSRRPPALPHRARTALAGAGAGAWQHLDGLTFGLSKPAPQLRPEALPSNPLFPLRVPSVFITHAIDQICSVRRPGRHLPSGPCPSCPTSPSRIGRIQPVHGRPAGLSARSRRDRRHL